MCFFRMFIENVCFTTQMGLEINSYTIGPRNKYVPLDMMLNIECRCFLGIQIQKCRFASYLMEHIHFEAQLYIKLSNFEGKLRILITPTRGYNINFG